jgi:type IV pilus assembly protein PilX
MKAIHRQPRFASGRQRGAALYVSLIMLILLALIGIVGMQVATLQERMSANYLASQMAFQRTEMVVRNAEIDVINGVANQGEDCAVSFDPQAWVDAVGAGDATAVRVRNISVCAGQCSAVGGTDGSESLCNWFRITGMARDRAAAATSSSLAAIDTTFIKP